MTTPKNPSDPSDSSHSSPPVAALGKAPETAPSTRPTVKPFSEDIRARLAAYRDEHNLTTSTLARELATNSTQVSKYLNGKPEGDVPRLEAIIVDVLKNADRRTKSKTNLFQNSVTNAVEAVCETIRKTSDIGLIHGPAGMGKSCGAALYHSKFPSSILITATGWQRGPADLIRLLWDQVETTSWNRSNTRAQYLAEKLNDTNRLLIVDNAQRITIGGLEFLFDFHDVTGCPIALLGNPSVLKKVESSDQLFSRIGYVREIKNLVDSKTTATQIIRQLVPESGDQLDDLGQIVAEQKGHARAVRKQVLLARDIRENAPNLPWATAFAAAHTKLIRDYSLTK